MEKMREIAVINRMRQMFYHSCHNFVKGPSFFADHEFFGEVYASAEADYDAVVERMIGTGHGALLEPAKLLHDVATMLESYSTIDKSVDDMFKDSLLVEIFLFNSIDSFLKEVNPSEGIKQLLGEMMNQCEMRIYKIKQRIRE
jgi:DNA-binding ferritin-like protein